MHTTPRLVAFDLDDTLAPSKSPMDPRMADLLVDLLGVAEVCIISGGQIAQFTAQVIERLPQADAATLERLHLMPTCGTQYYRHELGEWQRQYAEELTDDERGRALAAVEAAARALGYWEAETWGPILEDRGSQVTFSALGQAAPVHAKAEWDPTNEKKNTLRDAVQLELPDLEVRSGGSTSVDITRRGIDKAFGMRRLVEVSGIGLGEMLFVGDRLDEDGNDYPVKRLGVSCIAVEGWEDTLDVIEGILARAAGAAESVA
ncbi:haloacid dehalogenase [Agromyces rhizosphaerae]|uniref:phosphomannomutase n=1 Tax=Agromyces rhizosphaerae TaxID=88374 RepID=A0A9W6CPE3_9MICO|nr:HAD-IIB family hydrolase [Agromyces rhizosphaerae]GLI26083.1 haloacid dehalogenase [Agromyces rhizosphaerae]